jgi:hypothetical protein
MKKLGPQPTSGRSLALRRALYDAYYTLYPDDEAEDMAEAAERARDYVRASAPLPTRRDVSRNVRVCLDAQVLDGLKGIYAWLTRQDIFSPWTDDQAVKEALAFQPGAHERLTTFEMERVAFELALMGNDWRGFVSREQEREAFGPSWPEEGREAPRKSYVTDPQRLAAWKALPQPMRARYRAMRNWGRRHLGTEPDVVDRGAYGVG